MMKKSLLERTVRQSYPNPCSPIVRFLATPQRHMVISPDPYRLWLQIFLGTSDATVYCSLGDFE